MIFFGIKQMDDLATRSRCTRYKN